MIKKRIILIAVIAVLVIAMIPVYFFVVAPMLDTDTEPEKIELLDGETMGSATTILIFDQVERANIQSVEVHNDKGGYYFYYDEAKKDFFFKDYVNAPYSKEMISALVSNAGFPATIRRVTEKAEDLSEYGLAEADDPAYYILTTRDGIKHKVYIGNMAPTGAGFYTKYDGRDAVYLTEASISQTLLGDIKNFVTPMLFIPTSQTDYFTVKDFILSKGGEPFINITSKTTKQTTSTGEEYEDFVGFEMIFPANYPVSNNYDLLLQGFMECYGTSVVVMGKDDETITEEQLKEYKLDTPAYELLFTHNGIQNDIIISAQNEDGSYYAYSILFNIICLMPEETLNFLEWELLDFVDRPLIQYNINDISSITVTSKDFEETFIVYTSVGETTTNPVTGATTTATNIEVKMKSTGEYVKDPKNFRHFYMGLLTTNLVTYADVEDETGLECLATIKVITRQGNKVEFAFYPYSRRCFYTVNGKGEFYVLTDSVEKLVSDAKKLTTGETVNYQDKD